MQRMCDRCHRPYDAVRPQSRFCSAKCRTDASRARRKGLPESLPAVADIASAGASADGPLTLATRTQLAGASRDVSALGQAAIALAVRVDSGHENGSAVASLVRELRATLDAALDGAGRVDDAIDELKRRREQRRGA